MPKFLFVYHGGNKPETPEEVAEVMTKWNGWFETLGSAVVDGGNPVGMSKTVTSNDVLDHGGANPVSGYSIISADNAGDAAEKAKGCPVLEAGGEVELAEIVEM